MSTNYLLFKSNDFIDVPTISKHGRELNNDPKALVISLNSTHFSIDRVHEVDSILYSGLTPSKEPNWLIQLLNRSVGTF